MRIKFLTEGTDQSTCTNCVFFHFLSADGVGRNAYMDSNGYRSLPQHHLVSIHSGRAVGAVSPGLSEWRIQGENHKGRTTYQGVMLV